MIETVTQTNEISS